MTLAKWAQRARVRFIDGRSAGLGASTGASSGASSGASMVEYALLIGLVALVVIAGAILLGDSLVTKFSDFGSEVKNAP